MYQTQTQRNNKVYLAFPNNLRYVRCNRNVRKIAHNSDGVILAKTA